MLGTDIDCKLQSAELFICGPELELFASCLQHPQTNRNNQVGLFSKPYELVRAHHAMARMLPAQQRFGAYHLVHRIDLGLVIKRELFELQCVA